MKFKDKFHIENIFLISNSFSNLLPFVFNGYFLFASDKHFYNTPCSKKDQLYMLSYNTDAYGKYSIKTNAILSWNDMQNQLKNLFVRHFSPRTIWSLPTEIYRSDY